MTTAVPPPGRTPGRRGEKRRKVEGEDDERRRRGGRIVLNRTDSEEKAAHIIKDEREDIFGKKEHAGGSTSRLPKIADIKQESGMGSGNDSAGGGSMSKGKRIRVPQQILDNKAVRFRTNS
jgi:hypothetical protein